MSSKVDIVINVQSTEAGKQVENLDENIKKVKTDAEKPAKIKLDTEDAKKSAKGLGDALNNVKETGLGELSQKASELGGKINGVFGDITEVILKSAAAFGPIGIGITAVGAAFAFATQAIQEHEAAIALDNARVTELAGSTQNLGATYPTVVSAINNAKNAQEAHTLAVRANLEILREQQSLLGRGFGVAESQQFIVQLQQATAAAAQYSDILKGADQAMIQNVVTTGNAAQQQELLGFSFEHSANQAQENANQVAAMTLVNQHAREAIVAHTQATRDAAATAARTSAEEFARLDRATTSAETRDRLERIMIRNREALTVAVNAHNEALQRMAETASAAEAAEVNLHNGNIFAMRQTNDLSGIALRHAGERLGQIAREIAARRQHTAVNHEHETEKQRNAARIIQQNTFLATLEENAINRAAELRRIEDARNMAQITANRNLFTQGEQFANQERQRLQNATNLSEAQRLLAQAQSTQSPSMIGSIIDPNREIAIQLQRDEAEAARQLTLANQSLADSLLEIENARGITTPEMMQRRIQATQGVTNATNTLTRAQQANATNTQGPVKKSLEGLKDGLAGTASGLLSTAIAAGIAGESIGAAVQKKLSESLAALAEESAVQALFETAKGFAASFTNPVEAGTHFTSAGIFAATAAVAGLGAVALTPATAPTATAAGAAPGAAVSPARNESVAQKAPENITINLNAFQSNDAAQALIVRSLREAGYNNRGIRGVR